MASRGNVEVAYYDEAEAKLEKIPQVYQDFMYDNATDGGILALFDEAKAKIKTIREDVDGIKGTYTQLKELFDEFTNFNDNMDQISKAMEGKVNTIEQLFTNVVDTARQAVESHQKEDETLMTDLEQLNDMLGIDNGDEWDRSTASFVSGAGVASGNTGGGEGTGNAGGTGQSNNAGTSNADVSSVADDVIAGKYGTGDERKQALADAGYDPSEVQQIVNDKLNGTYTGETVVGKIDGAQAVEIGGEATPETKLAVEPDVQVGNANDTVTTTASTTAPTASGNSSSNNSNDDFAAISEQALKILYTDPSSVPAFNNNN